MDRRSFIKKAGLGVGGAAAATTLAAPAIAQSTTDMVIVSTWPRDFPGLGISAQRVAARIGELTTDKDAKIHLYCRSGNRSGIAQQTLQAMGFTNTINEGGYEAIVQRPQ